MAGGGDGSIRRLWYCGRRPLPRSGAGGEYHLPPTGRPKRCGEPIEGGYQRQLLKEKGGGGSGRRVLPRPRAPLTSSIWRIESWTFNNGDLVQFD